MTIFEWFVVISLWMHVGLQLVKRREYCSLRVEMTAMVLWPLAVAAGFIFNDSPTLWVAMRRTNEQPNRTKTADRG